MVSWMLNDFSKRLKLELRSASIERFWLSRYPFEYVVAQQPAVSSGLRSYYASSCLGWRRQRTRCLERGGRALAEA